MFGPFMSATDIRETLLRVLSMSASMLGFCVAGIGLLNAQPKAIGYVGLGDDVLGLAAVIFLVCTYLSFWALRTVKEDRLMKVSRAVHVLFIIGLTLVVACGIGIVYVLF